MSDEPTEREALTRVEYRRLQEAAQKDGPGEAVSLLAEVERILAERIAQARREALAPVDQALTGMAERPPYDLNDALRRLLALRVALRGDA